MRRPVCVEHWCRVAPREWDDVWQLRREPRRAREGRWRGEDGECTAASRVPVDANVCLGGVEHGLGRNIRGLRTPDAEITFVSHALLVTLMLSIPCSFLAVWPKTCLRTNKGLIRSDPTKIKGEHTDISMHGQSETCPFEFCVILWCEFSVSCQRFT